MRLRPFKLERYFAKYEFSSKYLLSSSDCDGLAQAEVVGWADDETRSLWENLRLGYTESLGLPQLREEVARLYAGIEPEEVLVCTPEEGIFIALNALLQPGDHVICTFPGYQSLYEIARGIGCEVTLWQPDEEDGWRFDPAFLARNLRPNTRLLVFNFPHNPTGYLAPGGDFQRIVEIARQHDLHVFSDEMYRLLEHNPQDRLPSACEVYGKAVSLFGMSKTFGMAGVRLGWLVTRDAALYERMAALKDYTTICSSAPSEILSLIALRNRERILARHLDRIQRNLTLADGFFGKHRDRFDWVRPKAGTVAFPRLAADEDPETFCERVNREAGVMLLPSTVYDYDRRHFRLGLGRESFPEALAALDAYLAH